MSRTTRLILPTLLAVFASQVAACAPTVFDDATALAVIGDPPPLPAPPPPPPPPEPEPEPPKRVVVEDNKISIGEKIQFDLDKATIRPESDGLMAEIISVIKENPHIKKIAIEGHTSSEGTDKHNLKLSDQRAKAVMNYLVTKGELPKEMFTAKGYGETRLIADESTEEGKEKNRRVEFNIVEQDVTKKKVEIDPKTGQKKVVEESTSTVANPSPETPSEAAAAGDAAAGDAAAGDAAAKEAK
ncbi:OmpA family protein [Nannocystis pusilla]|uniref:OmpA family protein n=1 Tax=Nannocystis pusilla TaxID=889268 RepID=A0ABS7TY18_9BACT|nr:OmpA family protein [Nannocystis pusilla]MBZ5713094.1 OmpA family protein [Nannocystis pusilla]